MLGCACAHGQSPARQNLYDSDSTHRKALSKLRVIAEELENRSRVLGAPPRQAKCACAHAVSCAHIAGIEAACQCDCNRIRDGGESRTTSGPVPIPQQGDWSTKLEEGFDTDISSIPNPASFGAALRLATQSRQQD